MEGQGSAHCARCGALVEGEACPQCGLARGAPAWQPPTAAAPYAPPQPPGPEQPAPTEPAPAPPPQQWAGPPPQDGQQGSGPEWAPSGPQLPRGELSGWWRRVGATLIDWLLGLLVTAAVFFAVWGASGDAEDAGVAAYVAYLFVSLVAYGLIYAPLLMARAGARNGQTLGKQALGIRVARLDGQPMDYGVGMLREWVAKTLVFQLAGAFVLGLAALLDYLWPLWDGRNQALHDKLASTVVMKA